MRGARHQRARRGGKRAAGEPDIGASITDGQCEPQGPAKVRRAVKSHTKKGGRYKRESSVAGSCGKEEGVQLLLQKGWARRQSTYVTCAGRVTVLSRESPVADKLSIVSKSMKIRGETKHKNHYHHQQKSAMWASGRRKHPETLRVLLFGLLVGLVEPRAVDLYIKKLLQNVSRLQSYVRPVKT